MSRAPGERFSLRSDGGTCIIELGKPWPYVVDVPHMNGYGQTEAEWIDLRNSVLGALNRSPTKPAAAMKAGMLFRWGSLWIGVHYSPANKRFCINLLPCVTVWVTLAGGITP